MSWKRRYVVRRQQPPGSVMKSTWRSSSATPAGSSPVSADGPGAIAASCRTSGWSQAANAYNPPQSAPMVRAEPPRCDVPAAASTLAVEDQADSVRPTDIEVVADDLFEEHPVIDRCVE